MKRTDRELHEKLTHTEWLQRWADAVADDEESAFTRRFMLAILLTFLVACGFWLAAWLMR